MSIDQLRYVPRRKILSRFVVTSFYPSLTAISSLLNLPANPNFRVSWIFLITTRGCTRIRATRRNFRVRSRDVP
jgi:hypothetical protein